MSSSTPGGADVATPSRPASIAALFGYGRSGTTWLGAMLNSHPDIAYRFEPNRALLDSIEGRIAKSNPALIAAMRELDGGRISSIADGERLRAALTPSLPFLDKPPFFHKNYEPRMKRFCRSLAWPLARKLPIAASVWSRLLTPRNFSTLVLKVVSCESACSGMTRLNAMPVIYLVRHPFAVVASNLSGHRLGLMSDAQMRVAADIIRENAPALHARFGGLIPDMPAHAREALLWRWSVETALQHRVGGGHRSIHVVFYENLCEDTIPTVEKALAHIGHAMTDEVSDFVRATSNPIGKTIREIGINRYFSVFRDPKSSMNKWKTQLSQSQQAAILDIVGDSPIFTEGALKARWWTKPAGAATA